MRWVRRLQYPAACVLVIAYAGMCHYCNAGGARGWGAAPAVAPLTLLASAVAWRSAPPPVA